MKVIEIINESQILNEQLAVFLKSLSAAIAKNSTKEIDDALITLAKAVGKNTTKAVPELGEAWFRTAKQMGTSVEDAMTLGQKHALAAGVDRATIRASKKYALELAEREGYQVGGAVTKLGRLGDNMTVVKSVLGTGFVAIDQLLVAWSIAKPIYDCIVAINENYKRWDAKDPEYMAAPQKLQGDVQLEIDECVRKVVAVLLGRKILGGIFGKNGIQRLPFMGGDKMASLFNLAGAASKTTFTAWLLTPQGAQAFAEWVVGSSLSAGLFRGMTDIISGLAMSGYNAILTAIDSNKAPQPAPPAPPAPPGRPQTRYDMATGRALN